MIGKMGTLRLCPNISGPSLKWTFFYKIHAEYLPRWVSQNVKCTYDHNLWHASDNFVYTLVHRTQNEHIPTNILWSRKIEKVTNYSALNLIKNREIKQKKTTKNNSVSLHSALESCGIPFYRMEFLLVSLTFFSESIDIFLLDSVPRRIFCHLLCF